MATRLALLSTGVGVVPVIMGLVREMAPEAQAFNIVDDSIVPSIAAAGNAITPAVRQRVAQYVRAAEAARADLALITCSSISELADQVQPFVGIPVLKIDEPMARQAVAMGTRIGVLATLPTTLAPTRCLIERMAAEAGRDVGIQEVLCSGAYDALSRGDDGAHDHLVRDAIERLAAAVDVIVLAQASMARAVREVSAFRVPVLTSPRSGVKAAIERLRAL